LLYIQLLFTNATVDALKIAQQAADMANPVNN